MLGLGKKEQKLFKLTCFKEGQVAHEFSLNQKKLLVGRFDGADICLDDNHISHYHAFIVIDEHGGKITDLDSDNGIFINGERVKNSFFSSGDSLKFGPLEFVVEEIILEDTKESETFVDQDAGHVTVLDESLIMDIPTELPPHPGLVVIDGEYCDILFDESHFVPAPHVPATDLDKSYNEFVDVIEDDSNVLPIARKSKNLAIEVTVMSMGNVLTVDYLPVKNKTYYISSKSRKKNVVLLECLDSSEDHPLLKVSNGDIQLFDIKGFDSVHVNKDNSNPFNGNEPISIQKGDVISYHHQSVQVIVKVVKAPPLLRGTPFFGRDRNFQVQTTKIFSTMMSLMLLLLLIDTTVEQPKKKVAIIYRKAIKSKKPSDTKSKSIADKVNKDTGTKKNDQKKKPTKMAKKSPTKAKTKPKKTKMKKVAKAKAAPKPKAVKKVPKMKAYKLKMNKSMSSLFGASKNLKPTKIKNSKSVASAVGTNSAAAASDSALKSKSSEAVGTLGQDFSGNYDSSSGSRGLASKSGIDTTYVDPKTVVLGSMDPELLRKILKEYLPQFRHCYQQELDINEGVQGVVDLDFRIKGNGKVGKIAIRSKKSKFSKSGINCMSSVLRLIDFPTPKGGGVVDVKQPLNFFSEKNKI